MWPFYGYPKIQAFPFYFSSRWRDFQMEELVWVELLHAAPGFAFSSSLFWPRWIFFLSQEHGRGCLSCGDDAIPSWLGSGWQELAATLWVSVWVICWWRECRFPVVWMDIGVVSEMRGHTLLTPGFREDLWQRLCGWGSIKRIAAPGLLSCVGRNPDLMAAVLPKMEQLIMFSFLWFTPFVL